MLDAKLLRPCMVKDGPTTRNIFLSAAPMELSRATVDGLLLMAEERLSKNGLSQPAHRPDQSDAAAQQLAVADGSKPTATAELEPRAVSARTTEKVSYLPSSLCPPCICFRWMMRTHLTSDAEGEPVLGLASAPKHDVFIS